MTVYIELTREFNAGATRAIVSSGPAVVMHGLALMSKDGDWIVREDQASLDHVLGVLEDHRAEYRFGAPLDLRWLRGGWSSHFEFRRRSLRVRTDFVTRPPRLEPDDLAGLWAEVQGMDVPVLDPRRLAEIKKTDREKDYPVIGELARHIDDPREQMLLSRSARDLIALAADNPELVGALQSRRPVLALIASGRQQLERALDEERRQLMRLNERRLERYITAAEDWVRAWPQVRSEIEGLPLRLAHDIVVGRAEGLLPNDPWSR